MPSEKVLEAKKAKVEQLTETLKNAVSFVIVDYKGITVEEDTKLRRDLRAENVKYSVEKNSLLRFALKNAGIEGLDDVLEGTTAIAVSNEDQTAPARVLITVTLISLFTVKILFPLIKIISIPNSPNLAKALVGICTLLDEVTLAFDVVTATPSLLIKFTFIDTPEKLREVSLKSICK